MNISREKLSKFCIAKEFNDWTKPVSSFDFSDDGQSLVVSSEDESITPYDTLHGNIMGRALNTKKYGVSLVTFTHEANQILHGSTKVDNAIRFLSIHDNKYIRYFRAHEGMVRNINMKPGENQFISCGDDCCIHFWDLNSPKAIGSMKFESPPLISFDPQGLVIAVARGSNLIELYDAKNYQAGPFRSFRQEQLKEFPWSHIQFSPSGEFILINTFGNNIFLIDAFQGNLVKNFYVNGERAQDRLWDICFNPEGNFIMTGNAEGRVHVFEVYGKGSADECMMLNSGKRSSESQNAHLRIEEKRFHFIS